MDISRRQLLGSAVALTATSIFAPPALAAGGGKELFATARAGLERMGRRVIHHDYVGVADFSNPSRKLRFHVLDMAGGKKSSLLVAHGRGSDPGHLGWVQRFSNDFGSNATSNGAYLTGDYYTGKHGRSMRLQGMDPTRSEEHTSELQSLMRISYAVFCLT